MSINTDYYGSESSWLNVPMTTDMTDSFMLGQYSNASLSSYGIISRTWLATKYGMSFETYKRDLDNSYGYCITDGGASFDNIMYCTGYNNNYPNRIKVYNKGKSTVGFAGYAYPSPYIKSDYLQYYKSSSSGGSSYYPAPLNFNPSYPFTPMIDEYDSGIKVMRVGNGFISPALKYDFGNYFVVPFIDAYILKPEYTMSDVEAVTNPSNYGSLFAGGYTYDLRRLYNDITSGTLSADKIVISSIYAKAYHMQWNEDGTYDVNDVSSGSSSSGSKCTPFSFFHSNNKTELTFTEWYKTTGAETITVNIDTSFIEHQFINLGSSVRMYDSKHNTATVGTVRDASVIAGSRYNYGILYDNLMTYPYCIIPCTYDDDHFTAKWFEDTSLSNTQKYSVAVYASLSSFGGIDAFREYVRKNIAYLGCYFAESIYPNATKDWNTTDCFIGTIDDSGVTHGAYTNGTDNDNQRQKQWGDNWSNKTPYNPNKPGPGPESDPNKYNKGMTTPVSRSFASATTLYSGSGTEVNTIMWFCNKVKNVEDFTNIDEMNLWLQRNFLTSNPLDNIISCKWFPFDTASFMGMGAKGNVKLGNTFVNVSGDYKTAGLTMYTSLSPIQVNTLYLGHFELLSAYDSYRDYSPYTDASLYFPYCGTIPLDVSYCVGHTIWIQYKIDINTGSCTAIASLDSYDGDIIGTGHGTISIDIPLSGVAQANYQNGIYNGIANIRSQQLNTRQSNFNNASKIVSGAIGTMTAGATGDVGGAIGSAAGLFNDIVNSSYTRERQEMNMEKARYSLKTTPVERVIIGNSSAADGSINYQYPAILITRSPVYTDVGDMTYISDLQGYSTCLYTSLSGVSGYTVCSDVHCVANNGWTEEEIQATIAMLNSGVYM